ncbi:MAG: acyltransferase [Thermoanaerobaculia bacterium]
MRTLRGVASTVYLSLNTIFWMSFVIPLAIVKLAVPARVVRKVLDRALNTVAESWIRGNSLMLAGVRHDVRGLEGLRRDHWYLVVSNHQSWADIFVLQHLLTGRIPLLKFFLKQILIWVPLIGLGWWALDFPFMKRHSAEFLRKHPERRGDDLIAIRKACEKFSLLPTAVVNFLEGTRFTPLKHRLGKSPYRHLLAPKAGGLGLALNAMGEQFHALLDVTIFYPGGAPSFFGFLSGTMREVVVDIRERPIPAELVSGNYAADPDFRARVQEWVGSMWREKDALLEMWRAGETEAS